MSALVGYKLVKIDTSEVVQTWGGAWGQCPGIPNPLPLPNGDQVGAPALDTDYSGFTLVRWEMDPPAPSTSPADYDLTKRQICAALIMGGLTTDPDAWMKGLMASIPSPVARALALNDWLNAPFYVRSNPLFSDPELIGPAGLNAAAIDGLWLVAKDLPQ